MSLPDKINMLERVGDLYLKSYKPAEIARALDITPAAAKSYIKDYQDLVKTQVASDPDFMDRLAENTMEALQRLDNIVKEAWETYDTAKDNDMISQQINLLKVAGDLEDKRAKLLQLMGAKIDGGMMARMNRAERVNEIVSRVIKDIIGDCPKCRLEAMPKLAEAFEIMNKIEEAAEMRPVDIVEEVIIEAEEEWTDDQHENMLIDVFGTES